MCFNIIKKIYIFFKNCCSNDGMIYVESQSLTESSELFNLSDSSSSSCVLFPYTPDEYEYGINKMAIF
jgi:hypothetical protein